MKLSKNFIGARERAKWRRSAHALDPHCAYCGQITVEGGTDDFTATVDHVQPLSRGGLDRPDNFALACRLCNRTKSGGKFSEKRRRDEILRKAFQSLSRPASNARLEQGTVV